MTGNYGDSAFNSPVVPREASIQCTQLTPRALALWLPSYCMARLARVVVSGHPHHVTQRGNGRARTLKPGKRGPKPSELESRR